MRHPARALPPEDPARAARLLVLHFPSKGKARTTHKRAGLKRKTYNTDEYLRSNDAQRDEVAIHFMLVRFNPIRIRHGRRSTWVDKFLVRWEPETCIFGEALERYRLGRDITYIASLEDEAPSYILQPFISAKSPSREHRRAFRRPPLATTCIAQFGPSPQKQEHIRSIAGGTQALALFLETHPP